MKKIFLGLVLSMAIISCKNEANSTSNNSENVEVAEASWESFGTEITPEGAISSNEMLKKYEQMAVGDSVQVKFAGKVNSVCQAKGCWMRLGLSDTDQESFVKFKDYKFFVPMDAADADAIIEGWAYKKETTIDQLKHYAQDAGKSEEEIAAITEPKMEYTFMADGVLLKKKG